MNPPSQLEYFLPLSDVDVDVDDDDDDDSGCDSVFDVVLYLFIIA